MARGAFTPPLASRVLFGSPSFPAAFTARAVRMQWRIYILLARKPTMTMTISMAPASSRGRHISSIWVGEASCAIAMYWALVGYIIWVESIPICPIRSTKTG